MPLAAGGGAQEEEKGFPPETGEPEAPFKIQFTPLTANIAEKSGYRLSTHSLEFTDPPQRRTYMDIQDATNNFPMQQDNGFVQNLITVGTEAPFSHGKPEAQFDLGPHSSSLSNQGMERSMIPMKPFTIPITLNQDTVMTPAAPLEPREEKVVPARVKSETTEDHYFELLYQPNEKQRKSYKNENRYILPNPLTIVLSKEKKEKRVKIEKGTANVKLLYDTGEELEENKEHVLNGVKTRPLDKEKKAQFHLKVIETSDRNRFRLQFTVRFFINKMEHVEKIVSHCFRVTSNKKCVSVERPRPFAIKPCSGLTTGETEVWIRGKMFTDRANTSVTFGGKPARVIETEENILVCYAPPRDDIDEDSMVEVRVINHKEDMTECLEGVRLLEFTYMADRRHKKSKKMGSLEPQPATVMADEPVPQESEATSSALFCPPSPSNYPQLDDIVKNESELIDRIGYFFPSYFPMEAV